MTRALKIENLKPINATEIQILRVISLHVGEKPSAFVDYQWIADSINEDRDTVRKAVNRMVERGILLKKDGRLSILNAVVVK